MVARAAHEHEAEIARLLENWARWPGHHGGTSSRSSAAWILDFVSRRQGDVGPIVPVMSGEAADTQAVLSRMGMHRPEARALVAYYTGRGCVADRLYAFNKGKRRADRIGDRQFRRLLEVARDSFWQLWLEVRHTATTVSARNQAQASITGKSEYAIAQPRDVPMSGPVTVVKLR